MHLSYATILTKHTVKGYCIGAFHKTSCLPIDFQKGPLVLTVTDFLNGVILEKKRTKTQDQTTLPPLPPILTFILLFLTALQWGLSTRVRIKQTKSVSSKYL